MANSKQTLHPNASTLLKPYYSALPSLKGDCVLHTRPGQGRTVQAAKAETDITTIVNRFLRTGVPPTSGRTPSYLDATALPNLQEALAVQARARQLYSQLPEQVRKETGGDPSRVESWVLDPRNRALAARLGLIQDNPASPSPEAEGARGGSGAAPAPSETGQTSNPAAK